MDNGIEKPRIIRRRAEHILKQRCNQDTNGNSASLRHNLEVQAVELQMQNEILRFTREELEKERDRYLELYEFSPVMYLTLDDLGHIMEANQTACQRLEIVKSGLKKTPLSRYLNREGADQYRIFRRKLCKSQARAKCELEMKIGLKPLFVEVYAIARPVEKRTMLALVDITERKNLEKEIEALRRKCHELNLSSTADSKHEERTSK